MMRSQLFTNFIFSIIKASLLLVSVSIAEQLLPAVFLGGLLLFRRQGALASNLLQLGSSQNIQRFCVNKGHITALESYGESFKIAAVCIILTLLTGLLFGDSLISFILGDAFQGQANWFFLYVAALIIGYVTISTWQSQFHFFAANISEIISGSVVFILVVTFWQVHDLKSLTQGFSLITFISSVLLFGLLMISLFKGNIKKLSLLIITSRFNLTQFRFGILRSTSAFLDVCLFSIGPWIIRDNLAEAGYLILALIFLRFVQTLVTPLSQVMSLRLLVASENKVAEERLLLSLLMSTLTIGFISSLFYPWVGEALVSIWLPSSYLSVDHYISSFIVFVPGIAGFYLLRNYVDLNFHSAINLYFLLGCLVLFVSVFFCYRLLFNSDPIATVILSMQVMFSSFYIYILIMVKHLLKKEV